MRTRRKNGRERDARRRALLSGVGSSSKPERSLPLAARLRAISESIPASQIAELWVFPPLPNRETTSEFLLLTCYDGAGRRRIVTAHVEAQSTDPENDEYEWIQKLEEHGAAPEDWVAGIPDRLLRRLADAGVPEVVEIAGEPERWAEAIARLTSGNGTGSV